MGIYETSNNMEYSSLITTSQNRPGLNDIHNKQNEIGKMANNK